MSDIRVTYSGLVSLVGGIVTIFTGVIFILIVTRTLSPVDFGTWSLINGLIVYVIIIEPIISYWATREITRGIESGRTAIISSGVLSLGGILGYIIIAYFVGQKTNVDLNILFFASILIPVKFLNATLTAINFGWKPHAISYGTLSFGIAQIPAALILIYFLKMGVQGVILTVVVAYLASIIILVIYARDKIKNEIKRNFLRKWLKLSWLPLYPGIVSIISGLDIVIFSSIVGSVLGLAYWSAAVSVVTLIGHSTLVSRAVYPKLLEGTNREYIRENLTLLFYFAIPFAILSITFAKPILFALNPIYQIVAPVVIFLAIEAFLGAVILVFQFLLTGIERVDVNEKSTFKAYFKSKLFLIPSLRLIQYGVYATILTVVFLFLAQTNSQLNLLLYWSIIALASDIPIIIFLYILVRRNFALRLDLTSIFKYMLIGCGVFGISYVLMEKFLDYKNNIFEFAPNLLLFISLGIGGYLLITYLIDSKTKKLFKDIIHEIKNKTF